MANQQQVYFSPVTDETALYTELRLYAMWVIKKDFEEDPFRIKQNIVKGLQQSPYITITESSPFPSTIQEIYTIYINNPITDTERILYMNIFERPIFGTGKSSKQLYAINPEVYRPVLDLLIRSKRYQKIMALKHPGALALYFIGPNFAKVHEKHRNSYKDSIKEQLEDMIQQAHIDVQETETQIALAMVSAVEQDPSLQGKTQSKGPATRRARKSRRQKTYKRKVNLR